MNAHVGLASSLPLHRTLSHSLTPARRTRHARRQQRRHLQRVLGEKVHRRPAQLLWHPWPTKTQTVQLEVQTRAGQVMALSSAVSTRSFKILRLLCAGVWCIWVLSVTALPTSSPASATTSSCGTQAQSTDSRAPTTSVGCSGSTRKRAGPRTQCVCPSLTIATTADTSSTRRARSTSKTRRGARLSTRNMTRMTTHMRQLMCLGRSSEQLACGRGR